MGHQQLHSRVASSAAVLTGSSCQSHLIVVGCGLVDVVERKVLNRKLNATRGNVREIKFKERPSEVEKGGGIYLAAKVTRMCVSSSG